MKIPRPNEPATKSFSLRWIVISLIGIVIQMIYNVFIVKALQVYGPGAILMPIMVIGVGLFLIWYSKLSISKGWLT